jgi:transglutaminase-like putative cysteine protease
MLAMMALATTSQITLGAPSPDGVAPLKSRGFDFTYAATITELPAGQPARVWIPVPSNSEDQKVQTLHSELPGDPQPGSDAINGNKILYFQANARADGEIVLSVTYRVARMESAESPSHPLEDPSERYLQPDRLVPVGGKPLTLVQGRTLPTDQFQLAHLLYDVVDDHMQYRKDQPGWGRGDAAWACDSGCGNCTDFHSLFIALARSEHLPAKFEIGFEIPQKRGSGPVTGYHCWAKVLPQGHGWVPVDISQANQNPGQRSYYFGHLDDNRVAFSIGRDLILTPKQDGPPVNFFIYPYVEVGGKPLPAGQIQMHCGYTDVPAGQLEIAHK